MTKIKAIRWARQMAIDLQISQSIYEVVIDGLNLFAVANFYDVEDPICTFHPKPEKCYVHKV